MSVARVLLAGVLLALLSSATTLHADHTPLGPKEPSAEEQRGIWTLNRARHDPTAYGNEIGEDLSAVPPQPPLAVNQNLTGSARFHAKEMLDHDYFGHTSQVTGDGPNQMAVDHGYNLFGDGLGKDWGAQNFIESIAFGQNRIPSYPSALKLLIIDEGVPGKGHRVHLLATNPGFASHREIGCGRATSGDVRLYAIHTGNVAESDRFLTGVVYLDKNGNGKYDTGEGIGGATVTAGAFETTTLKEGGYSLKVPAGQYTVSCTGGSFVASAQADVTVSGGNVEVDFRSGNGAGDVDFDLAPDTPPLTGPTITASGAPATGTAPLQVDFQAQSSGAGTAFSWDFGDGSVRANQADVPHTYADPGLYAAVVSGTDSLGTGTAAVLVSVGGAAGAGQGTTPPGSTALVPKNVKAKANFKKAGKDIVKLKGSIEMPAGFVPGAHEVVVAFGGVVAAFTLTEKNKAVDPDTKSKVVIKYRKPKGNPPLAAGVIAKVTVKLKGDLAAALVATGLRNATEKPTLDAVPFALLLNELAYRGEAPFDVNSKAGKRSKASLAD